MHHPQACLARLFSHATPLHELLSPMGMCPFLPSTSSSAATLQGQVKTRVPMRPALVHLYTLCLCYSSCFLWSPPSHLLDVSLLSSCPLHHPRGKIQGSRRTSWGHQMSPLKEGFWKPDLYLGWEGGTALSSHHSCIPSLSQHWGLPKGLMDMPLPLHPFQKGLTHVPGPWPIL